MKIILEGEQAIRVQVAGAGLEVEAREPGLAFSPLHMLAASLATCTLAVVAQWGMRADLEIEDLEIGTRWDYVEDPYRVGSFEVVLEWPSLPENRRNAALHVAGHCTVEHTLTHPPMIDVRFAG